MISSTHSISVVMPVHNEEKNLRSTLAQAREELSALTADWEIIVIESGSTDRSLEILTQEAAADPRIRCLHQERREGLGSAFRAGYRECRKRWVCHLDADMPFDLDYFRVAAEHFDDSDFISGYRSGTESGGRFWLYTEQTLPSMVLRAVYHYGYRALARLVFGPSVEDVNFSFKVIRRSMVHGLDLRSKGWFFDTELTLELLKSNARIKTIPVKYRHREQGESKVSVFAAIPLLVELIHYRATRWSSLRAPKVRDAADPL